MSNSFFNQWETVEKVLNAPPKTMSKKELRETLKQCGALNSKGNVVPAYRGIINEKAIM